MIGTSLWFKKFKGSWLGQATGSSARVQGFCWMSYMGRKYEFRLMSVNKSLILDFDAYGDEIARDIEQAFSQCHSVQGGNVHAIYVCEGNTPEIFLALETKWDAKTNHAIRSLSRFFNGKNVKTGEYFIKHMTWAPMPDQRRSYHDIESMKLGKDWYREDQKFSVTWLRLYVMFKTLSFGWGDEDVYVGDAVKGNRHCRYCPCTDDRKFSEDAHAISESLGNKHVFSNEECDDCNEYFSHKEENFLRLMDVRRTLYRISGKGANSRVVKGKNFAIRPNAQHDPMIYLKKEMLPEGIDESMTFAMKLEPVSSIVNEDIYKALVKYVVGLLPGDELPHFSNTIEWLKGRLVDNDLPTIWMGIHDQVFRQPVLDIYINEKGLANTPYCTGVLYTCDVVYMFVVPFVDVDKGRFMKDDELASHWRMMKRYNYYAQVWYPQASSEFWKGNTWVNWVMRPGEYKILPSSDPVFGEDDIKVDKQEEKTFPDVKSLGLRVAGIHDAEFNVLSQRQVALEEMNKCSVNLLVNRLEVSENWMSAVLYFQILVSDTNNQERFYEVHFTGRIEAGQPLSNNIDVEEAESDEPERGYQITIDYHLMQAIDALLMTAAESVIAPKRRGTSFEHCTMTKLLEFDCIRLMEKRDVVLLGVGKAGAAQ